MMIQGIMVIWLCLIVHNSEDSLGDPFWRFVLEGGFDYFVLIYTLATYKSLTIGLHFQVGHP